MYWFRYFSWEEKAWKYILDLLFSKCNLPGDQKRWCKPSLSKDDVPWVIILTWKRLLCHTDTFFNNYFHSASIYICVWNISLGTLTILIARIASWYTWSAARCTPNHGHLYRDVHGQMNGVPRSSADRSTTAESRVRANWSNRFTVTHAQPEIQISIGL